MPASVPSGVIPGPADRESFLDAQARNRRASWWFTALSALTIGLVGVPLSAVVSPLLYAAALIGNDVVNLVVPTPDVLARLGESQHGGGPLPPVVIALIAVAVILPGSLALLLAWAGVRRVFRRAGAGATVLALGARPPRPGVAEEQQAANVAGELAVAAGIPPPRVLILDSPVANAAAVGTSTDDCAVVVTTGLLAALDRDETQGVIAHVVAAAGNGDLRIGLTIASVFQTIGLVGLVLSAPADRDARRLVWRLARAAVRRPDPAEAAVLAEALTRAGADPDLTGQEPAGIRAALTLPFQISAAAYQATASIWGYLLVNPFLRRAWISRRYLADAAAVQLTRNPDGLARGVAKLGGTVPGAQWTAHLFAGGDAEPKDEGSVTMRTYQPRLDRRLDRLRAMGASSAPALRPRTRGQRAAIALVALVFSPCWVPLAGIVLVAPLLLGYAAIMVDAIFLAPFVAALHVLLR